MTSDVRAPAHAGALRCARALARLASSPAAAALATVLAFGGCAEFASLSATDPDRTGAPPPSAPAAARQEPSAAPDAARDLNEMVVQGIRYFEGLGVARDEERAVVLFKEAAEHGDPEGQIALATAFQTGRGIARDEEAAATWLKAAAVQDHVEAQYLLGLAYKRGRGVVQDAAVAREWFERAADHGSIDSAYELGVAYSLGQGGEEDDSTANRWFEFAATKGHAKAQFLIGSAYTNGRGVGKDHLWAARWYERAALQGVAAAQYMLGVYYGAGLGLPLDLEAGYRWLAIAAAQGHKDAISLRESVGQRLAPAVRARLDAQAAGWQPQDATLGLGDRPTVRYIQFALVKAGYEPGPADGILGEQTRAALEKFKADRAIDGAGVVTPAVLLALRAITGTPPGGEETAKQRSKVSEKGPSSSAPARA